MDAQDEELKTQARAEGIVIATRLARQSGWIFVGDGVPEDGEFVIGYYADAEYEICCWNAAKQEFNVPAMDFEWPGADPTHWMPLPNPPAGKD